MNSSSTRINLLYCCGLYSHCWTVNGQLKLISWFVLNDSTIIKNKKINIVIPSFNPKLNRLVNGKMKRLSDDFFFHLLSFHLPFCKRLIYDSAACKEMHLISEERCMWMWNDCRFFPISNAIVPPQTHYLLKYFSHFLFFLLLLLSVFSYYLHATEQLPTPKKKTKYERWNEKRNNKNNINENISYESIIQLSSDSIHESSSQHNACVIFCLQRDLFVRTSFLLCKYIQMVCFSNAGIYVLFVAILHESGLVATTELISVNLDRFFLSFVDFNA